MNCIVTVDLETFALTRQIVDSSVKFDSEYENGSGYITCNGSIFQEMDDSTSLYSASSKNNSLQNCIYSSSSDNNGMGSNDWFGNAGCVKPGIVVSN